MTEQAAAPAAPAAPVAPAAPAAPVAPAAPAQPAAGTPSPAPAQPAAEGAPAAEAGPEPVTWAKTGDAGLDMALGFVGARGFGPQHPAIQAAVNGDFSLLRAELAGLGNKAQGYEAYVALAEKAYQADKARAETQDAASREAVHTAVGGVENWQAIHQWAKANADPHERAEINAMFDAGPRQAKAAALYLKTLYENANGSVQAPANPVKPTASGGYSAGSGAPITDAREYAQAVMALEQKLGKNHVQDSPEYRQLQQRRLAGRRIAR